VSYTFAWLAAHPQRLCVPKSSSTSCDQAIFADQASDVSLFSGRGSGRDRPGRVEVSAARLRAGRRWGGGHKLTGQILAWAEEQLAADPALKPAGLAGPIAVEFGVHVHPRSIERALARFREHSKSR
jgi:hypothetical protein